MTTLERRLDALTLQLTTNRPAMPLGLRRGRWYGKLDGALTAGGTTDCVLWVWDIADDEWQVTTVTISDVRSFWDVPLPDEFPVQVEWVGNSWVVVDYQREWAGKADSAITKGSTGTISLWDYQSSVMADTTMNVTALAWGAAITSGKIVNCYPTGHGIWLVGPWEC